MNTYNVPEHIIKRVHTLAEISDGAFEASDHIADDGDPEFADELWKYGVRAANDAHAIASEHALTIF